MEREIKVNGYPNEEARRTQNQKLKTFLGMATDPKELVRCIDKGRREMDLYIEYLTEDGTSIGQEQAFRILGASIDPISECYVWDGERIY